MSVTRLLIRQGGQSFRFLKIEAAFDGSLYVGFDRDPTARIAAQIDEDAKASSVPSPFGTPRPHLRFSLHPTGRINLHSNAAKETIWIEPLTALTQTFFFGILSIPRISQLHDFIPENDGLETIHTWELPDESSRRITFMFEIGPKGIQPPPYGVAVNYEIYSLVS